MQFFLKNQLIKSKDIDILLSDKLTFLGSCFSDEIAKEFDKIGFDVCSNPFGTIFHPLAIAELLMTENLSEFNFQQEDRFLNWYCASYINNTDVISFETEIKKIPTDFRERIQKTDVLFVTFGTAWGYIHNALKKVVGNCHKEDITFFKKELSSVYEMLIQWNKTILFLKHINPDIKIVFTISPVRHIKDGLIENNRSKARLFELVFGLVDTINTSYFPSYEIIMDELRDYRFFKKDLIHPTEDAITYVWEKLMYFYFPEHVKYSVNELIKYFVMEDHVLINPNSISSLTFEDNKRKFKKKLMLKYPFLMWDKLNENA